MKASMLFLALCFAGLPIHTQTLQVIKIAGTIQRCAKGDTLRMQDKINLTDTLCFTNKTAQPPVAALIDLKTKERFLLQPKAATKAIQKVPVKDNLTRSRAMTGTRHGKLNTLLDLQVFLGDGDFLVLGGRLPLVLHPENLAMNADSFFYISYQYQEETINKKLSFSGDTLYLSAKELYQVDDKPIPAAETSDFRLYYYQPGLKRRQLVAQFTPVFPAEGEIVKELDVIFVAYAGDKGAAPDKEHLRADLASYLIELYGKADVDQLNAWLDRYLVKKG